MRMTPYQDTNHLICSYEDTKKSRDANGFLRMALQFNLGGTDSCVDLSMKVAPTIQ